jgi:hypothetical protein
MKSSLGELEKYRITTGARASDASWGFNGAFLVPRGGLRYLCLVSDEGGWDHVSITIRNKRLTQIQRTPTWEECCFVKDLFWAKQETVIQFHPPESEYVNIHPYCLHLWRPQGLDLPLPPRIFV